MFSNDLTDIATRLLEDLRARDLRLVTAESCTGGLIAGCLTAVPGSSDVVDRGFVTYSNAAKQQMLGVPEALLIAHGAVSAPVALAMAQGALARSEADLAVSVTGIAGPGGGTATKPVGLVHLAAVSGSGAERSERVIFDGDRDAVRQGAVVKALELLRAVAEG
ncbi:MAG: CinA family protein [Magnetospiraceae bacterium]